MSFLKSFVATFVVLIAIGVVPTASSAADEFGVADAQGTAFPGPSAFWAGTCDTGSAPAPGSQIGGGVGTRPLSTSGGPTPQIPVDCIDLGDHNSTIHPSSLSWTRPPEWRLPSVAQAGAHPDATATFTFRRDPAIPTEAPLDNPRDVMVDLPAGFVGDPTAVPYCPSEAVRQTPAACPPETQIGTATLVFRALAFSVTTYPLYNVEPRRGNAAEFLIPSAGGFTNVPLLAQVRTDGDFGVTSVSRQLPTGYPLLATQVTLWGVPWSSSHDSSRSGESYDASWGPIRPFVSNPGECSGSSISTLLRVNSWEDPEIVKSYDAEASPVTGCESSPFDPDIDLNPESGVADGASGLDAELTLPQNDDPPADVAQDPDYASGAPAFWRSVEGVATAQLKKAVVTLPEGVSVNPAAATGLEACSDDQMGVKPGTADPVLFTNDEPTCPDGAKIGTVVITTPLLEEKLAGEVVLGTPKSTDPQSGQMFRLFLVARNDERGLLAKIAGSAVADPDTGRLTATFDQNPRVPFEELRLRLKGGKRGVLALPPRCSGEHRSASLFTPWSRAHLPVSAQAPVDVGQDWVVDQDCDYGFAPSLRAGMDTARAGAHGGLSFVFGRPQGDQTLSGLTANLPAGLLAKIEGVALCSDGEAAAGACPAASRIGSVDASAGSGSPFVLERKGDVYLTEGYKGGAYGLLVKVPVVAGPFRGDMQLGDVLVRQSIRVDRRTAQVTAVSDPLPQIWHGVPLRVREVRVRIDRPGFMLNGTDCAPKQVEATLGSGQGATATAGSPFQLAGCAGVPFAPKLTLATTGRGRVRTGAHPGIRAVVTQAGVGEAGIRKAVVRLPKSLALDPGNAQALCEFEDGTKPDLENRCPKGSIVGRARARTPLLNEDLVGNVYFVKNVRKDSTTGNLIRTLPMIVVALRGEIAVNLVGESSTTKGGKLVNTFASVPDAPIERFELDIAGGKTGILAVTRTRKAKINICASRQIAEADMDGQNGRRHDTDVRIKTPCTKAQVKKAKREAKKAAASR